MTFVLGEGPPSPLQAPTSKPVGKASNYLLLIFYPFVLGWDKFSYISYLMSPRKYVTNCLQCEWTCNVVLWKAIYCGEKFHSILLIIEIFIFTNSETRLSFRVHTYNRIVL